ncbi:MAG: hypothetical protein WEA58_03925 [Balneolaceae bacterium]
MKNSILQYLVTFLIVAGISSGITWYMVPAKVVYSTEYQQEQLNELTVELRNTIVTSNVLRDSLKRTEEEFRDRLNRKDEEIASYTRIYADLRLDRDSLKTQNVALSSLLLLNDDPSGNTYADTTLTATAVFGNDLLKGTSTGGIKDDELFINPPELEMLRPLMIDNAVTITKDRTAVHSIVTSEDLFNVQIESFTEIKPEKKFPWKWVFLGSGFAAGVWVAS